MSFEFFLIAWFICGVVGVAGRRINEGVLMPNEIAFGVAFGPITLVGELYKAVTGPNEPPFSGA